MYLPMFTAYENSVYLFTVWRKGGGEGREARTNIPSIPSLSLFLQLCLYMCLLTPLFFLSQLSSSSHNFRGFVPWCDDIPHAQGHSSSIPSHGQLLSHDSSCASFIFFHTITRHRFFFSPLSCILLYTYTHALSLASSCIRYFHPKISGVRGLSSPSWVTFPHT